MGTSTPVPMGMSTLTAGPPTTSYCLLPEISCSIWRTRFASRTLQLKPRQAPGPRIGRLTFQEGVMEQQQLGFFTVGRSEGLMNVRAVGQSDSDYLEREEVRWIREEQRWLREEQRWLREEARWNTERQAWAQESIALNNEIKALKQEILALQEAGKSATPSGSTLADLMAGLNSLLRSLREAETVGTRTSSAQAQIASSSSSSRKIDSIPFKDAVPVVATYLTPVELVAKAPTTALKLELKQEPVAIPKSTKAPSAVAQRRILKRGAEGDDVKVLQEALEALGFYSGEEDMEYSVFDAGTERAVKTWQSSVGVTEDGILTKELLASLLGETPRSTLVVEKKVSSPTGKATATAPQSPPKGTAMKSKPTKASPAPEIERYAMSSTDTRSERRVFLLGENRWEEPSRLMNRNGQGTAPSVQGETTNAKCFSCNGAGSMMCTECEGTGELNVEEQFLDWVEDGAKCPYCEGSGAVKCDVCS